MAPIGPALPRQHIVRTHSLEGHSSAVLAVEFTNNGRYVLSASQDQSVRLWNPHNGMHVKRYVGPHNHEINDVVVTDDNSKFYSCGGDKQFFSWDVTTAQIIRKFTGHDRKVNSLAFGPGQDVVVSGSHDKSVRIWDLRSRSRGHIQSLNEATDSVLCVCVNGDEIVSGSTDGCLRRYDVRKGLLVVDQLLQPIGSISFSKDRECMLVSTLDSKIHLLECETGNHLQTYEGHVNKKYKIQSVLDPSNAFVVSGSEDNKVCIWDLAEGNLVASVSEHGGPVFCATFFEDTLVTAAADGAVYVWASSLSSFEPPSQENAATGFVRASNEGLPTNFGRRSRQASANECGETVVPPASLSVIAEGQQSKPSAAETEPACDGSLVQKSTKESDSLDVSAATAVRKRGDRGKKNKRKRSGE